MLIKIDKLFTKINVILLPLILFLILPNISLAQNTAMDNLQKVAQTNGPYAVATETSISSMIGMLVLAFLGLLGSIFIILMLLAGYNWMTAAGEEAKVEKAKDTIQRAIIGLLIVVASFAIWQFLFVRILQGGTGS